MSRIMTDHVSGIAISACPGLDEQFGTLLHNSSLRALATMEILPPFFKRKYLRQDFNKTNLFQT